MIPYTWSMFSSAPVVNLNIPPTLVPTVSMFTLLTRAPTKNSIISSPTMSPIIQPSILPTPLPITSFPITSLPITSFPTSIPTFKPSTMPTVTPTPIPTNIPSMIPTTISTTGNLETSSTGKEVNTSNNSSTTIGAVVGSIILLLLLILACAFLIRKQSKTPYENWTTHYNKNNTPIEPAPVENEDIHHFYNRSPRPSVHVYPAFTPHISSRETLRGSTVSTRYDTHQGLHRGSINMVNRNNAL